MIKRVLLAVALLASALMGFTAVQTATAPVAGATCSGPNSLDFGWYDGKTSVFHAVADFFYDANCNSVTHYVVDCFPRNQPPAYVSACAQGWLDPWAAIIGIYNGTVFNGAWINGQIEIGPPNITNAGVALMDDNSNAAWCQLDWATSQHQSAICARTWSGSEWHNTSYVGAQYYNAWTNHGATVELLF